jgi:hypothetical protein
VNEWDLNVTGCGTAGFWTVLGLMSSPAARHLRRAVFIDHAAIQPHNAVTCPLYAGFASRPKSLRLQELAVRSIGRPIETQAIVAPVEGLDWQQLGAWPTGQAGRPCIVLVGLDDWQSRLIVAEDMRYHAAAAGRSAVMIQVGLDRDQAQVCVYGSAYGDPCPACGVLSLPGREPCVVYLAGNKLLRGNLRCEARAAARLVRKIVCGLVQPGPGEGAWVNTKTNLCARRSRPAGGPAFERLTRTRRMTPGCLGPHSPHGPVRWDPLWQGQASRSGGDNP